MITSQEYTQKKTLGGKETSSNAQKRRLKITRKTTDEMVALTDRDILETPQKFQELGKNIDAALVSITSITKPLRQNSLKTNQSPLLVSTSHLANENLDSTFGSPVLSKTKGHNKMGNGLCTYGSAARKPNKLFYDETVLGDDDDEPEEESQQSREYGDEFSD